MIAVAFASIAAFIWGISDYAGAWATRRIPLLTVVFVVYLCASVITGIGAAISGGWSTVAMFAGIGAGVAAILGYLAFFRALAIGPIAVNSPLIALVETIVPVSLAVGIRHESLSALGWTGVAAGIIASLLFAVPTTHSTQKRVTWQAIVLSLFSGTMLGVSIVALDLAPRNARLTPAFAETISGMIILLIVMAALRMKRQRSRPSQVAPINPTTVTLPTAGRTKRRREAVLIALVSGACLGISDLLLIQALHVGELAVVSVIAGLYPVSTILCAVAFDRERIGLWRSIAVVACLVAAACFALQ